MILKTYETSTIARDVLRTSDVRNELNDDGSFDHRGFTFPADVIAGWLNFCDGMRSFIVVKYYKATDEAGIANLASGPSYTKLLREFGL